MLSVLTNLQANCPLQQTLYAWLALSGMVQKIIMQACHYSHDAHYLYLGGDWLLTRAQTPHNFNASPPYLPSHSITTTGTTFEVHSTPTD